MQKDTNSINFLTSPVQLSGRDKNAVIPLWGALLALALPVFATIVLLYIVIYKISPDWSPFLGVALGVPMLALLLLKRSDLQVKRTKGLLDLSWNIWSAVGLAILLHSVMFNDGKGLTERLLELGPGWATFYFSYAFSVACGRVAVPLVEFVTSYRQLKSTG